MWSVAYSSRGFFPLQSSPVGGGNSRLMGQSQDQIKIVTRKLEQVYVITPVIKPKTTKQTTAESILLGEILQYTRQSPFLPLRSSCQTIVDFAASLESGAIWYYCYSNNLVYSPRLKDNISHSTYILIPHLHQDGHLLCKTPSHSCFHSSLSELQRIQTAYMECNSSSKPFTYAHLSYHGYRFQLNWLGSLLKPG